MDIDKAKQQVIDAGKRLVEQGLISRTWGNVSCRIDKNSFVITPSGKLYDTLTPAQIVLVNTETLAYDGDVKPSSEKGVHAEVYKARPDVNFVIHTHQKSASVISALGSDIKNLSSEASELIGSDVPLAKYGLPGTKTLMKGVARALERSGSNAMIMAHHGTLCFGTDSGSAFETALQLEEVCGRYIFDRFKKEYGLEIKDMRQFIEGMAEKAAGAKNIDFSQTADYTSRREKDNFVLSFSDGSKKSVVMNIQTGKALNCEELPAEAVLHNAVYRARDDIYCIIHSRQSDLLAVSCLGKNIKPQVDDFAQIVGADIRCTEFDEKNPDKSAAACAKAMKGRHALLLKNNGALCCGPNENDAQAVEMITEKNSLAFLGTMLFHYYKPISPLHSHLMRYIYLKKYSKQAR